MQQQRQRPTDTGTNRLYQREGSPYWQAEWYDADGTRHQRSTRTADRVAALAKLRAWERAAADPSRAATHETTLKGALEALQALRAEEAKAGRKSEATVSFVTKKCIHPMRLFGGSMRLVKLDAAAIDGYIATRRAEGAAESSIHKELVVLRGACALAGRRGKWPHDLAKVFPRGFSPEYKPRTRWLPPEELAALLEDLKAHTPDRAAVVAFIVATGAEWAAVERARASSARPSG